MIIDWNEKPEDMNAYCWTTASTSTGHGCWLNTEDPFGDIGASRYTITESQLLKHKSDKFNLWVADLDIFSNTGWYRLAGACLVDPDVAFYESADNPFKDRQDLHIHIPPGVFVEGLNSRPDVDQLPNDDLICDSDEQPDPIHDPSPNN